MPRLALAALVLAIPLAAPPAAAAEDGAATERRPLYYPRLLEPADLEGRTLRELALMRNWIHARSGTVFRREWLREFFSRQPWYAPRPGGASARLDSVDRRNAEAIARHELALPRAELRARRDRLAALAEPSAEDQIERMLLAERLGEWSGVHGVVPSPLQDPSRLDRQLALSDLDDFSRRDLALLRHTIRARRGRPFAAEWLRRHFERFEWYRPDPGYSDRRLGRVDRRNLRLVASLEHELGGPLADESTWLGEA